MEARSAAATQLHRRCVVVHLSDLSVDAFEDLVQRGAGAILVIFPERIERAAIAEVSVWWELYGELEGW